MNSINLGKARRLLRNQSGVAMVEFAFALPLLVGIGMAGIELANQAVTTQRLNAIATSAADNVARVRNAISEDDINELVFGIKRMGEPVNFSQQGRIIISSIRPVMNVALPTQVASQNIRWQRCFGAHAGNSSHGNQGDTIAGENSIGPVGQKIGASAGSELIYVEMVYEYRPIVRFLSRGSRDWRIHRAFTVRDRVNNDIQSGATTARSCALAHSAE